MPVQTKAEISEKLREFLQSIAPSPGKVLTDTTALRDEWRLNSLSVLEIGAFIEDVFDVEVRQQDITAVNFATVSSLADFVLSRSNKA
jgi:acyl carrier protein